MTDSIINTAIEKWKTARPPKINPGCTHSKAADFQRKFGAPLPKDVLSLYTAFDGFNQNEDYQDENGFNIWPLDKIEPLRTFSDGKYFSSATDEGLFVFSDYLDFSWGYAFRATHNSSGTAPVYIVAETDDERTLIANGILRFLELLLKDDPILYSV